MGARRRVDREAIVQWKIGRLGNCEGQWANFLI